MHIRSLSSRVQSTVQRTYRNHHNILHLHYCILYFTFYIHYTLPVPVLYTFYTFYITFQLPGYLYSFFTSFTQLSNECVLLLCYVIFSF
jgi:hypothetical protein